MHIDSQSRPETKGTITIRELTFLGSLDYIFMLEQNRHYRTLQHP